MTPMNVLRVDCNSYFDVVPLRTTKPRHFPRCCCVSLRLSIKFLSSRPMCIYIRRKTIRGRGRKSVASIRESRARDVAQKHLRCSAPNPKISVWQHDHPADSPTDSMTQASGRRLTSRSSGNVLKIVYARNALSWHASRWTSGSRRGSAAASLTGNRSH